MRQICNEVKKIFKIENIILLTVVGLPLYLVKLDFFGIPANVLDILQLTVVVWWLWEIKKRKSYLREKISEDRKLFLAAGLIFCGIVFSILLNGNYRAGAGILKSWFILPFLFALIAADVFKREIEKIFRTLYWSITATAIIALVYWALGHVTYDGRLEAFFNSPNYLGMFLAPGIIIGTFFLKENKKLFGISMAAIIMAFYLTRSYAAWISAAGALCLASILMSKERKKIILGTLAILIVVISYQVGTKKLENLSPLRERSSLSSRLMIWKVTGNMIKDNFIWGIGPGNFQRKYLEYQKFYPPYLEWAVPHPHSIYLAFWAGTGLIGLIGFLWLTADWLRNILKQKDSRINFILFGIIIYFLLHGLVDTTYFKNDLSVVFWLTIFSLKQGKGTKV